MKYLLLEALAKLLRVKISFSFPPDAHLCD